MSNENKQFKVRSKREQDWFWIDNEFVENGYLALNKSVAAVYLCLCKYANNKTQDPHPSLRTMSEVTGLDRNTIRKNIELLEKYHLVHISSEQGKYGVRYVYNLLDKTEWLSVEDVERKEKEGGEKFTRSKIHPVKKLAEGGEKLHLNKTNKDKTNNIYIPPHQIEFIEKMWNIYPYGSKKKVEDWVKFKKPDLNLINNILEKLRQYKQKLIRENREDKYYKQLENWLEDRMYLSDFSPKGGTVNQQIAYDQDPEGGDVMTRFNPGDSDINLDDLRAALSEDIRSGVVDAVFGNMLIKVNKKNVDIYMGSEFDKERAENYREQLTESLKSMLKAGDIELNIKT